MKHKLTALIFMTAIGSSSGAVDLSIDTAVQLALKHSLLLKREKAESEAYRSNLNAVKAERYPELSFEAKALHNSAISTLDIQLPGYSLQRDIGRHEVYQTDLKLSVPVYTGGKISAAISLAEANSIIKATLFQESVNEISFLAKQEYIKLYKAHKLVDAARSSLARAELLRNDVRSLYNAGAADSVDLLEVELSHSASELDLEQSINGRRRQEIVLLIMLGLATDESINVEAPLPAPESLVDMKLEAVNENKPELKAALSMVTAKESLVRLNRASYVPKLSLFSGYSYGKPNISPFEDKFNGNFSVGAALSWSFNLGGQAASKTSMAGYLLESSRHDYDRLYEQIQEQSNLSFENLKLAYSSFQTASKNYQISGDNFRLAQIKHQQGILSANHLLDIEANLSRAESMLYSTEADYRLALIQYDYIIGRDLKEGK